MSNTWTAISITGDDGTNVGFKLDHRGKIRWNTLTTTQVDPPKPLPFPVEIQKPEARTSVRRNRKEED
jgi:hypothetical protein